MPSIVKISVLKQRSLSLSKVDGAFSNEGTLKMNKKRPKNRVYKQAATLVNLRSQAK